MAFWKGAGKRRRDTNEPAIVDALRGVGAEVFYVSGRGLPDLIVKFRGRFYVGEVKTAKGKETEHQGAFPIWRTPEQVLTHIGATTCRE